jgi:calcineurin-like phosphoesterase family protein
MKKWITADLHFGDTNVIQYTKRPFTHADEMDRELIKKWNNVVKKDDTIYILGDFTLSHNKDYIKGLCNQLNGKKILILGNHDTRHPKDYIQCGFYAAIRAPILYGTNVVLAYSPPHVDEMIDGLSYIHGHTHNKPHPLDQHPKVICVSIELTDYQPVELNDILKRLNQ